MSPRTPSNGAQQQRVDPQKEVSFSKAFQEDLQRIESAVEATRTDYWKDLFKEKKKAIDIAAKQIEDFVEGHDMKDSQAITHLKKMASRAVEISEDFEDFIQPIVTLVSNIMAYHHEHPLYKACFTHTADFNRGTGVIKIQEAQA